MAVFYFNITYRCNSSCIFCAANHPLYQDEREMSAAEFDSILEQQNVSKDDRVIVNGGEPTVHRELESILDAIHRRGAKIDLYTNGLRFQDEAFVKRVLAFEDMHIRVPLFGSTAAAHDLLTGAAGHFEATTKGLDNLCRSISSPKTTLEIKLLLSKITVKNNEAIYDLVRSRWHHPSMHVSLNPLLLSECVLERKDMFVERYDVMMKASEPLIRKAIAEDPHFSVSLIPYCAFPDRELLELTHGCRRGGQFFYASPGYTKRIDDMEWRTPCRTCCYVNECNGYPKNYIEYFGESVMKPIAECSIADKT